MDTSPFNQRPVIRGRADIVICLDVTGSMQPCIDRLKEHIRSFVQELERARDVAGVQLSITDWRIRLLPFRDLFRPGKVLPPIIDDLPFVSSAEELEAQLQDRRLRAGGGGSDGPESALDALYRAARGSDWRAGVHRVAIMFTDNYPLQELHPSSVGEGGPRDVDSVIQALKEKSVGVAVFAPDHPVMRRISKLRPKVGEASLFFSGVKAAKAFFGGDSMEFHRLLRTLAATVSNASLAVC